ncbi:MAG: hypothetical protein HY458_01160 [Parcubacteria group bacterium]|nr:hypothetical protein [Parcubacteria group bacterium]
MHLLLDEQGYVTQSSIQLQEGLNVAGKVYGVVRPGFLSQPVALDEFQGLSPGMLDAAGVFFSILNGKLEFAAPDMAAARDLFYAQDPEGSWILGDDFFEVASRFPELTWHRESTDFFVRHGYFPPGATYVKEICRVKVGTKIAIAKGGVQEESLWQETIQTGERTYETFKRAFDSAIESHIPSSQDAVLLSSGVDSGLIAALLVKKFQKYPLACTSRYVQVLKGDEIDGYWVPKITSHLGLEHMFMDVDFNRLALSHYLPLLRIMPLAATISGGYLLITKEAAARGKKNIWTGQSADSVYNFGPTTKTLGSLLKRFYLSKQYWSTFPDIQERSFLRFLWRHVGAVGMLAFRHKRNTPFRQPRSFREFLYTFEQAEESLGLPRGESIGESEHRPRPITLGEAKKLFFDRKVQSFLTGRDPRIKYAAAELHGMEAHLPYSAANMLYFFRGLELGLRDVLYPKRFIYRYLQELLGKSAFLSLYGSRRIPEQNKTFLTWNEWQANILDHTSFGKELRGATPPSFSLPFNVRNLQHVFDVFWLSQVRQTLQEKGVEISPL